MSSPQLLAGIDAGSVTLKLLICSPGGEILFSAYERHRSDPLGCLLLLLEKAGACLGPFRLRTIVSGTAGYLLSQAMEMEHQQEVFAASLALRSWAPQLRTAIELGGEDAKIIFFEPQPEQRMNGTCAGGTGAFIDQMVSLLKLNPVELDRLAAQTEISHAIASRCGVFAKSDVQGLLSRGVSLPEVARSVMKAVVLQTVSGLGFGRRIEGPLAFLGGPFHYLPTLKRLFTDHLKLEDRDVVAIKHDLFAVAYGCILSSQSRPDLPFIPFDTLQDRLKASIRNRSLMNSEKHLPPLTSGHGLPANIKEFTLPVIEWTQADGPFFLGIDCGSTTSKLCLCDDRGRIVFQRYHDNGISSLNTVVQLLKEMNAALPSGSIIANTGVTGYGESLLKAALGIDMSEVETLAHAQAARTIFPNVEAILDIGGQDMKYIRFREGQIDKIVLNEACSSGCGTFLQTFADSLNISLEEFCRLGRESAHPVDLGTRCTVFMNSKIKEAQRNGADCGDLSAGLAYSVIRNALYKVLKLSTAADLGQKVIVQGGTFRNDSVLMALALETGVEIIRPDHPELMGAYGMALLARDRMESHRNRSSLINSEQLDNFTIKSEQFHCQGCTNRCSVTRSTFSGGGTFISGYRCERRQTVEEKRNDIPNLYRYKSSRLFQYRPLSNSEAPLGVIGLPRVLNIYEHYPFWFTLLTRLGFRVQLSPPSRQLCPEDGWEYLSSEAVCYPAKIVYTHILYLIRMGIRHIFFPCLPREQAGNGQDFRYNCPIVTSFPEVLRNNLDILNSHNIRFDTPFLPIHRRDRLWKHLRTVFPRDQIGDGILRNAIKEAYLELDRYRGDLLSEGDKAIQWLKKNPQEKGVVLAGRPYHLDDEIHHGIPDMVESLGLAVISEDSLPELDPDRLQKNLRVIDQWGYHHRLYNAAHHVIGEKALQMVQLNSFGCGIDAITIDQVEEILQQGGKHLTVLKIDENSQLGAARIRLRSLFGAPARLVPPRRNTEATPKNRPGTAGDTILIPQMSAVHFPYLEQAFRASGYPVTLLPPPGPRTVETGLRHANHDICYPAIIIIGQMIEALQSGKWDPARVTLLLSQTGGGCRASNYVSLLQRALDHAGFTQVPILTLAGSTRVQSPAIRYTLPLIKRIILSQSFGDLDLRLRNRFSPVVPGIFRQLIDKYRPTMFELIRSLDLSAVRKLSNRICHDFQPYFHLPRRSRVGLVGEIFIKYNELGNNNLVRTLEEDGYEVVQPDIMGFAQYCAYDRIANHRLLGDSWLPRSIAGMFIRLTEKIRGMAMDGLSMMDPGKETHHSIHRLAELAAPLISTGNQCGEGWYLTAEMAAMLEEGIRRIICVQPFGCLANHISGRGMIKKLRQMYPGADILPLDFDPGSSAVNQYNRLKLFLG